MDISQLRGYRNWIGNSPVEIRGAVIAAGGWAQVFPMNGSVFPEWAARVRNYFNVTPRTLELLPPVKDDRRTIKNRLGFNIWIPAPFQLHAFALNGDVYVDETGRPWFEMDKVGAVYHFPGKVNWEKKLGALYAKYAQMPVFKLISPDDTGGSLELCVYNLNQASTIGKVGAVVRLPPRLVDDEFYRGSYNYAETVVRGLEEHEYRDVKAPAHKEERGFYVNPPTYSSIAGRRFPERDGRGKLLGFEKGFEPYEIDITRPDRPGDGTTTDPLAERMAPRYPPNHPGSIDRVKRLEELFRRTLRPKRLLARIEARNASDKAANDFHAILAPDTVRRLLKILRDRPPD